MNRRLPVKRIFIEAESDLAGTLKLFSGDGNRTIIIFLAALIDLQTRASDFLSALNIESNLKRVGLP